MRPVTPTSLPPARTPDAPSAARIPPQSLEAEQALLGSMMYDREAVGLVLQIIPREDATRFYRSDHRKLFALLIDVYDSGEPMDLVVVRDALERRGLLEEVGGIEYLTELVESVPSAAHAEHYARIVRDKSLLRDLISVSGEVVDKAYGHREEAQQIFDEAERLLFGVTEKRIRNPAVQIRDLLGSIFKELEGEERHYINGVPTGFLELDDLLNGLQRGELVIVAARPSMGKTALGLSIAEHIAIDEQIPVAFFSMEMSREQIARRILCSRGKVDSQKVRRNRLNDRELTALRDVAGDLEEKPFFVDDTPGMTVMELRAKARRLALVYQVQCIIVDYLQLMSDPVSGRESRQHEIATISRGLKALARELNVPIIALAQLNRNPEGREGNRPRMSDLRESGAIEQDADTIILLHREEYYLKDKKDEKSLNLMEQYRGMAELIVAKQRNGPTGTVKLTFVQSSTRFEPYTVAPAPDSYVRGSSDDHDATAEELSPF